MNANYAFCDMCTKFIKAGASQRLAYLTAREGCKHKICKPCISFIFKERAAGSCIPCPVGRGCTGVFDVENVRYDADVVGSDEVHVVTPQKVTSRGNKASPDVVKSSYKVPFNYADYRKLCSRYLSEPVYEKEVGGMRLLRKKKSRLLDQKTVGYQELGKAVDRLRRYNYHEKAYELLWQLRDCEMNHAGSQPNCSDDTEIIDLTGDDDKCIDVDTYIFDVLLPSVKKEESEWSDDDATVFADHVTSYATTKEPSVSPVKSEPVLKSESSVKPEPISSRSNECVTDSTSRSSVSGAKRSLDELSDKSDDDVVIVKSEPRAEHEKDNQCKQDESDRASESVVLVKSEPKADQSRTNQCTQHESDSDDESRFSQGCPEKSNYQATVLRDAVYDSEAESTIFGDSDDDSRFSSCPAFINSDQNPEDATNTETNPKQYYGDIEIKSEETKIKERSKLRKHGDRVLLARQSPRGMMKLGGGNQGTSMWPVDMEARMSRFNGRYCMALNDSWNPDGPKYAGQLSASVSEWPDDDDGNPHSEPFSVFMKRTFEPIKSNGSKCKPKLLGWEYCGEYRVIDDGMGDWMTSVPPKQTDKDYIIYKIKRSLSHSNGLWHYLLSRSRENIQQILENRPDSHDAENLRSLGLDDENMTDNELAEKVVYWEGFYHSRLVEFVNYDDDMYDFVKAGETTRNKHGNKKKNCELCAMASDWYDKHDQMVGG